MAIINIKLEIPTYDGSNQAVHPDVYYNEAGWNGYKYWMALTPYPDGNDAYENPSIVVSNDNVTWIVPPGVTNPVVPAPTSGANCDPDLVYNSGLNRLELYYTEDHGSAGGSIFKRKTSTNGINWSTTETLFTLPGFGIQTSAATYVNGVLHMWYIEYIVPFPSVTYVWYRNSSDDGLTWSTPQRVTLNTTVWGAHHIDVEYVQDKDEFWFALLSFSMGDPTIKKVFLATATSTDKLNLKVWTDKEITKSDQVWKSTSIYRTSLFYDKTRNVLRLWDSGRNNLVWSIGYTEYPLSIIPCDNPSCNFILNY